MREVLNPAAQQALTVRIEQMLVQGEGAFGVECAVVVELQRDQALRAHASQVDPNGVFFAVPSEQLKDIWPWEDYTLAASHAEVQLPESSLDEGLSDYYVI